MPSAAVMPQWCTTLEMAVTHVDAVNSHVQEKEYGPFGALICVCQRFREAHNSLHDEYTPQA